MYHITNLEIHAVDHCNYACKGCSHFAPFWSGVHVAEEYLEPLVFLQTYANVENLHILGGEPTLHPDLATFVGKIKEKTSAKIRLFTNGWWLQTPGKFDDTLKLIDELILSLHIPPRSKPMVFDTLIPSLLGIIKENHPHLFVENKTDDFFRFSTTQFAMNRSSCRFYRFCTQLLCNGKIAPCSLVGFIPDSLATSQFAFARESSYFDVMSGNKFSIRDWFDKLPPCCEFCSYEKFSSLPKSELDQIAQPVTVKRKTFL